MTQIQRSHRPVYFDHSMLAEHCPDAPYSPAPDIIALIIGHADPRSLKMLSLTCRRWYPVARMYLFHTIRIRSSVYCKGFIQFLLSGSRRMPMQITFLRHVREIILQDYPFHNVDVALAVATFQMLPNIRKVTLAYWRVGGLPEVLIDGLRNSFTKLTSLQLHECDVADPYTFVQLVCAFPKVSRIHVGDPKLLVQSSWSGAYDDLTSEALGAMKHILNPQAVNEWTSLCTLIIRKLDLLPSKHCLRMAAVLLQPRFELNLRYLRINWNCPRVEPLLQLLDNIAQGPGRLEEIVFAVEGLTDKTLQQQLREKIKAVPVDYVRSLTFGKINLRPGTERNSLLWVNVLLWHIFELRTWVVVGEPRHLVELRFHLRFEGPLNTLEGFNWNNLVDALCTGRQRISIGRDLAVSIQVWVQDHLRWLEPSGVEELQEYLRRKVRGTGCGIRYVQSCMPTGEEEGSVEFELTEWNGLPLMRTSTWNPRHYLNW